MTEEYETKYREAMEEVGVPVVRMRNFTHDFMDVRYRLAKGENLLLVSNSIPLAFIRPLSKEDLSNKDTVIMSVEKIRNNRDEFLFTLHDGNAVVLGFRGRIIGLITPEIPQQFLEAFEKAWMGFASADRKKRWREKYKREHLNNKELE
jgi:hypothetical protein